MPSQTESASSGCNESLAAITTYRVVGEAGSYGMVAGDAGEGIGAHRSDW